MSASARVLFAATAPTMIVLIVVASVPVYLAVVVAAAFGAAIVEIGRLG